MAFSAQLPQIIVEAALVASDPVSGSGTITLDDATFGKLDTDWLAGADAWTDITAWLRSFMITRPSSREQGPLIQFQAGTASIVLNNSDGRFDPSNLSGPYVISGVSQIHAMVPVRIRAIWSGIEYPLFRGFADSWQEPQIDFAGDVSDWTLTATDGFKILNGVTLTTVSPAGANEDTGARINRILNSANWYTGQGGGARFIDTGSSKLQATTYGDNALSLMQLATDSEIGHLYIDGSGAVVFRNRHSLLTDSRSTTSQAVFSDSSVDDGHLPCASVARADDDTTIANDIQAQIAGSSNLQEASDAASIVKYLFPRTYSRTDLITTSDTDALNWAHWVLYISKDAENRFESITVDPQYQPEDLWPHVLGRDIGDRITGVRNPPPVGTFTVEKDGFISGIAHTFDVASSNWSTTWTLQDASKYGSFFTLDDPILGRLDNNALTY